MLGAGIILFAMGIIFLNASFNHWPEYGSTFFACCVAGCGIGSILMSFVFFGWV